MSGPLAIVPFAQSFDRNSFSCGFPDLDQWLRRYASQSEATGNTRVFFAVDADRIVGYYAQRTTQLEPDEIARMHRIGRYRYPMPAVLIARLAVDSEQQGSGLGTRLLIDALYRMARLSGEIGFEIVVVHAISRDASVFYRRAGFRPFEAEPLHLFLHVKDLRRTYGVS